MTKTSVSKSISPKKTVSKKTTSESTVDVWIKLWQAHHSASSTVKEVVKQGKMPALEWYDILLELTRAPKEGLRAYEILEKCLFPQYSLSRLLTRLETEGLVKKSTSEEDGRGQVVQITPKGRELQKAMWPIYGSGIEAAIGDKLSEKEKQTLTTLLAKLC